MPALGEWLVHHGVCSPAQVEEALQGQVILGGRLGTNLLELGFIDEPTLAAWLGAQHRVPALHGSGLRPSTASLPLLPASLVTKLNVMPYELTDRGLRVLCLDPGNLPALDDVAFRVRLKVEPVVVPEARFWWLLRKHYRVNRGLRGLDLVDQDVMVPAATAPPASGGDLVSPRPTAPPAAPAPAAHRPSFDFDLMPEEEFAATYARRPEAPAPPEEPAPDLPPPSVAASWGPPAPAAEPWMDLPVLTGTAVVLDAPEEGLPLVSGTIFEEATAAPSPVDADSPLSFAEATALLKGAASRQEVARCVMRHARTLFSRVILFTVHKSWVAGWDCVGEEMDRRRIRDVIIPLGGTSIFKLVADSRGHFLGGLQKTKLNIHFLKLLGKKVPLSAFLMPVLVQGRLVNMLYGDNGHRQHCGHDIGELLILALKISQSYQAMHEARLARQDGTADPATSS
jgi:hypothetical protein